MNNYIATINKVKKNIIFNGSGKFDVDGKIYNPNFNEAAKNCISIDLNNKKYNFAIERIDDERFGFLFEGQYFVVTIRTKLKETAHEVIKQRFGSDNHNLIKAPMPGLLLKINKSVGDEIEAGESVAILEAMKMENEIHSPVTGKVLEIFAEEGTNLEKNSKIILIG